MEIAREKSEADAASDTARMLTCYIFFNMRHYDIHDLTLFGWQERRQFCYQSFDGKNKFLAVGIWRQCRAFSLDGFVGYIVLAHFFSIHFIDFLDYCGCSLIPPKLLSNIFAQLELFP